MSVQLFRICKSAGKGTSNAIRGDRNPHECNLDRLSTRHLELHPGAGSRKTSSIHPHPSSPKGLCQALVAAKASAATCTVRAVSCRQWIAQSTVSFKKIMLRLPSRNVLHAQRSKNFLDIVEHVFHKHLLSWSSIPQSNLLIPGKYWIYRSRKR